MTQDEKKHLSAVAGLGCIICRRMGHQDSPAEVHHIRAGTGKGQRSSHFDTLPLCPPHHRGNEGVHGLGTKGFVKRYGVTEHELLEEVLKLLEETRQRESIFPKNGKMSLPPSSGSPPQG
jgi:hypothetical protein